MTEAPLHFVKKTPDQLRAEISALVQQFSDIVHAPRPFVPGETAVPVSGKVIGAKELQLMVEASLDGWLTTGRFNTMFEERLAAFLGVKYLITVNSGSSANLVAFSTLTSSRLGDRAIKPGDEVIGVAAGFPTTVNPILQFGAVPVFVDVDLATHNIDASKIEAAISPKTKAIMLAHSLGNPFNLEVVTAICKKHGLWLVEDCCDALGAKYNGQLVGTFGDIGTLSFYPAHHITMGEGGAVFTNDPELKLIAESFRDWGRDCYCPPGKDNTCNKRFCWKLGDLPEGYDHKYTYSHLGYNLKISDMQAACALAQMDRVDDFIAARKANFKYLKERLANCAQFLHLPEATPNSEPSWFGFPLVLKEDAGVKRADLINFLDQSKIATRLLFAGNLTRQPYMIGRKFRISGELTNTDTVMNQTFWLGVWPGLAKEQLDYVADKLEEFFGLNFDPEARMTSMIATTNALKAKLVAGGTVLGVWSIVPSPVVAEIMGLSGFDFAILDMEHGIFDMASLDACVRAVEVAGAVPLVRIPGMNASAAQWALDLGAHGIVVPQLRDAQDAAAVVAMAKYAPMGQRGYNPFTRAANYANPADNRSGKLDNAFSLTCVIVESESALADLDGICATSGVDVVYMGIYDLAVALGCAGDTRHPRVVEVVETAIARIRAAGKAAGMMVRNAADVAKALSLGANFLVYGVDTFLIREAAVAAVETFGRAVEYRARTESLSLTKDPT